MHPTTRLRALVSTLVLALATTYGHSATFNYHGNLKDGGVSAEGNYDLELTLHSAPTGGSIIGGPVRLYAVPVHAGNFSTEVDFGPLEKSSRQAWVSVKVRSAGIGDFASLPARAAISTVSADSVCPGAWTLAGNAGNPAGSYLGTADDQPLVLMANGQTLATFIGSTNTTPANSVALGTATATGYQDFAAGDGTSATGPAATALGAGSQAIGHTSFAAGQNAIATHDGSFVWADDSSNSSFGTTGVRQFLIRAAGGVGIGTNNPGGRDLLVVGNNGVFVENNGSSTSAIFGSSLATTGSSSGVVGASFSPAGYGITAENLAGGTGLYVSSNGTVPAISTSTGATLSSGGQWVNASDRNIKGGFAAIDVGSVLAKVVSLPVTNWFYKSEGESVRHIGPVAQDFSAAFGLGNSDKAIGTVDESGIALAAIQGLNQKLESENASLRSELDALRTRLDKLDAARSP